MSRDVSRGVRFWKVPFALGLALSLALLCPSRVFADALALIPRFEILPGVSSVLGGDSYLKTDTVGLGLQYHLAPQLSLGVASAYALNELRSEGEAWLSEQRAKEGSESQDIDYPRGELLALVNWYPLKGQLAFNRGSGEGEGTGGQARFQLYVLLGAGRIFLSSGSSSVTTLGAGIRLRGGERVNVRLELRSQAYAVRRLEERERLETTVAGVQLGYLID